MPVRKISPAPGSGTPSGLRLFLFSAFFISGANGLIFELVFRRLLHLSLGVTHYSVGTIITVFMAGLGIGSIIFGGVADRSKRPVLLYGILECATGALILLLSGLQGYLDSLYVSLNAVWHTPLSAGLGVKTLLAGLFLLPVTILMGGTLPLIAKSVSRAKSGFGRPLGLLYGLNTLGGVAGTLGATFYLMGNLGSYTTLLLITGASICIGLTAAALHFMQGKARTFHPDETETAGFQLRVGVSHQAAGPGPVERAPAPASVPAGSVTAGSTPGDSGAMPEGVPPLGRSAPDRSTPDRRTSGRLKKRASSVTDCGGLAFIRTVMAMSLVAGFVGLSVEVYWTRILAYVIGSHGYAFGIILASYLSGLGLGSVLFSRFVDQVRFKGALLGILFVLIGITLFAASLVLFSARGLASWLALRTGSWGLFLFMEMGLLFLIMLVPTILMGGVFPLIISITTTAYRTLGRYVGRIYFLNTLGSIAGGSLGSFLLMHHLGVSLSLKTSILVSIGAGVTVLAVQYFSPASRELRNRLRRISTSSGSSVRTYGKTVRLRRQTVRRRTRSASWRTPVVSGTVAAGLIILLLPLGSPLQKLGENERLLFYREAASATVSVREDAEGGRMLSINGLDEVPVDPSSLLTFKVLAHLPLLIHPDPEDVMVVSLGGGITTGSVSTHPVESITAVELVPPVVQAADYFAEWNHQVLAEPRLSVVLQDGRNHMLVSPDQYDVITADATHPWSADSWILYTREFYQLVKSRLAADGIFCQWIPLHWLAEQDFKCILRTMGEIFPDLTLWYTGSYAVVLSGPAEYQVDIQQLEERLNQEKVKNDLSAVGINSPSVLFSLFLLSPEGVGEYTGEGPVNTDNLPILEHSAARCFGIETTPLNLRSLALVREHPERFLSGTSPDPALGTSSEPANPLPGLDQLFDARDLMIQGRIATYEGDFSEAIELYAEAMDRAPRDGVSPLFHQDAVRTHAADTARRGDEFRRMGDLSRARSTYYEALRIDPGQPRAHNGLGMLAYAEGRYGEALDQYARALDRMPYQVQIRHNLVLTLLKLGRVEYAEQEIDAIEELEKDMPGSHVAEVLRGYLAQVRG